MERWLSRPDLKCVAWYKLVVGAWLSAWNTKLGTRSIDYLCLSLSISDHRLFWTATNKHAYTKIQRVTTKEKVQRTMISKNYSVQWHTIITAYNDIQELQHTMTYKNYSVQWHTRITAYNDIQELQHTMTYKNYSIQWHTRITAYNDIP